MTNPNTQIVNAGVEYVFGLKNTWLSATTIGILPGYARSFDNTNDMILNGTFNNPALIINVAIIGANGFDRPGPLAANTRYLVFLIADSTENYPIAAIISINGSGPNMPAGYDVFRRIGSIRTDGSGNILKFYQFGVSPDKYYFYDVPIAVLTSGSATTFTSIQLPQVSSEYNSIAYFNVTYTPAVATNTAQFIAAGSTATSGLISFGTGVAGAQVGQLILPIVLLGGISQVQYKVSAGDSLSMSVAGFQDALGN